MSIGSEWIVFDMKTKVETPLDDELRPEYDESVLKNGVRGKYYEAYRAGHTVNIHQADGSTIVRHDKFEDGAEVLVSEAREYSADQSKEHEQPHRPPRNRRTRRREVGELLLEALRLEHRTPHGWARFSLRPDQRG